METPNTATPKKRPNTSRYALIGFFMQVIYHLTPFKDMQKATNQVAFIFCRLNF